jgi:hypothetical protein
VHAPFAGVCAQVLTAFQAAALSASTGPHMETFAHFENIPLEIGRHLGTASAEIVVAVA